MAEITAEDIASMIREGRGDDWRGSRSYRPRVATMRVSVAPPKRDGDMWIIGYAVGAAGTGGWRGTCLSLAWDTKQGADLIAAAMWRRGNEIYELVQEEVDPVDVADLVMGEGDGPWHGASLRADRRRRRAP